ncbi:RNA_cap guanine-N2 methyltransferase [Hexamita inflata]|uniref:Trimethylguanosine synthase n=1 Tax=Hexamita inflata TaxID=28002 RepID=A0AA86RNB4_9EUKA|nr:RNA cap guanine-N2 methyltransferase [Hexamita inflata]
MKTVAHYSGKLPIYYSFLPFQALDELKHTDEALYSVSAFNVAFDIGRLANHIFVDLFNIPNYSCLDLTCCVGGDSFAQSFFCTQVESYELNPNTYQCLKNNISVFAKYGYKNVHKIVAFNDSSLLHLSPQVIKDDFLCIIDPPWGGPDFMKQSKLRLKLGEMEIEQITNQLLSTSKLVILKLPRNYDYQYLKENVKGHLFPLQYRSILFVFVTTTPIQQDLMQWCDVNSILLGTDLLKIENETKMVKKFNYFFKDTRGLIDVVETLQDLINFSIRQKKFSVVIRKGTNVNFRHLTRLIQAIAIGNQIQSCVFAEDEQLRAQLDTFVKSLPEFVQLTAGTHPSIINLQFPLDEYLCSIGENDTRACFSIILRGCQWGRGFIALDRALEFVCEVFESFSPFVKWVCRQQV